METVLTQLQQAAAAIDEAKDRAVDLTFVTLPNVEVERLGEVIGLVDAAAAAIRLAIGIVHTRCIRLPTIDPEFYM